MKNYLINWRKKDTNKLRSSIAKFNNKIKKLQKRGITNLPELANYRNIKSEIMTRSEYNKKIASLESFLKKGAESKINLGNGIEVTRWERRELQRQRRIAIKNLTDELSGLSQTLGTGNTRINEIKSTLESLKNWEKTDASTYKRRKERIQYLGQSDLKMKQARLFQKNFIKAYKTMGRKEIIEVAKRFKNPLDFWNYIQDSGLTDLQLQYDIKNGDVRLNMDADDTYYYELFKLGITL